MTELGNIHLAVPAVLAALLTAGCATVLPDDAAVPEAEPEAALLEEALPPDEGVDLATRDQVPLYAGWRAETVLGAPVYGPDGEQVGEVEDILIGPDATARALIVDAGGFLDIGDARLRVPWKEVQLGPDLESAIVPVTEATVGEYDRFRDGAEVTTAAGPRAAFRATELLADAAALGNGAGYGAVDDLIFSRAGKLLAVIVTPDDLAAVPLPVPEGQLYYAAPFFSYGYGFYPDSDR